MAKPPRAQAGPYRGPERVTGPYVPLDLGDDPDGDNTAENGGPRYEREVATAQETLTDDPEAFTQHHTALMRAFKQTWSEKKMLRDENETLKRVLADAGNELEMLRERLADSARAAGRGIDFKDGRETPPGIGEWVEAYFPEPLGAVRGQVSEVNTSASGDGTFDIRALPGGNSYRVQPGTRWARTVSPF